MLREVMDHQSGFQFPVYEGTSISETNSDFPIKYTPVTGRISRAKKGVKVHTCETCHKVFTRAEHLR